MRRPIPYVEIVKKVNGQAISSTVRPAKLREVLEAYQKHVDGKCDHRIVFDTKGFMYDERECWICGAGCGLI